MTFQPKMDAMKSPKRIYVETYGCQMNLADTEVVQSVLHDAGYLKTENLTEADVIFVNTCAIRENAEARIYGRLGDFKHLKRENPSVIVGVLGCMAERLRKDLMETESHVDLVVGPDEYRRLPELVAGALEGERGIAVRLSRVENYDDIPPPHRRCQRLGLRHAWLRQVLHLLRRAVHPGP